MKITELRQKQKSELSKLLIENRDCLRVLRFNSVAGKIKNVKEISKIRKDIARILTLLKSS